MTRSRASARTAGTRFERSLADCLAAHVDERIDRRVRTGAKDRGDIANLRTAHGAKVTVEAKDCATTKLGPWHDEAVLEMGNDDAVVAVVAHKRRGKGDPLDQWVTMSVRDLVAMITGERP